MKIKVTDRDNKKIGREFSPKINLMFPYTFTKESEDDSDVPADGTNVASKKKIMFALQAK